MIKNLIPQSAKQVAAVSLTITALLLSTAPPSVSQTRPNNGSPSTSPSGPEIFTQKNVSPSFAPQIAAVGPEGFEDTAVISGLNQPTKVRFASDGRIFVAEKGGTIKVIPSLSDPTPTVFADLSRQVMNYWDRGLIGMALHPDFPTTPYIYISYTLDAPLGGTPPVFNDACSDPNGAGCVVANRVSRLTASGNTMASGSEKILIEDWCQQYPSHAVGDLQFGDDGSLYVSGGEGANFNTVDYGQLGGNPCNDPANQGGALRSQDIRTTGDPLGLSGTLIRIDPETGEALESNPLYGGSTSADDRILAHGFRNPFRFTIHPTTKEIWIGDVGMNTWEEVNRLQAPLTAPVKNFGWPCYEGAARQPGYEAANLPLCQGLYSDNSAIAPYYTYNHNGLNASITGLAFYTGSTYPESYRNALFIGDYSVGWIKVMHPNGSGLPSTSNITTLATGVFPIDITTGPEGDIFYADLGANEIRRIQYSSTNNPPNAVIKTNISSGAAPLTVQFDGSDSSDPDEGNTLSYAWDLDGDGTFTDSTAEAPQYTYTDNGDYLVGLRVTDNVGAEDTDTITISVGNQAPIATITSPAESATYKVGDTITFAGQAIDPDESNLFGHFNSGLHPEGFNRVQQYWTTGPTTFYPYIGKSSVGRGSDAGEANAPAPAGVFDMQMHPPNNAHLTVAAFVIPQDGTYSVSNLGARRVDGNAGQSVRFKVFNSAKALIGNIQTTSQAWVTSATTHSLGALKAGDRVYFAADADGGYWWDATEVRWTVTGSIGGSTRTWNSHSVTTKTGSPQATVADTSNTITANLELYESANDGGVDVDLGRLPASALSWQITLLHCSHLDPEQCHRHPLQTIDGVDQGTIQAPDHEYPSRLEFALTATEPANGTPGQVRLKDTKTRLMEPQTVDITFRSEPAGLNLSVYGTAQRTPFTRTMIVNASTDISAPTPQTLEGATYTFASWSDDGAQTHSITAGEAPMTLTATYEGDTTSPISWQSYDVTTQAGTPQATVKDSDGENAATIEFYESANDGGVDAGATFSQYTTGLHYDPFNNLNSFWSRVAGGGYPYVGKSSVARGSDTGESNAPSPAGVFDLQLHPPDNAHLTVAAFVVPQDGTYAVSNLAARRIDGNTGQTARFKVFGPTKALLSNIQTGSRAWTTSTTTHSLGSLAEGDRIYFAVDADGAFWWDATEVRWTITRTQ